MRLLSLSFVLLGFVSSLSAHRYPTSDQPRRTTDLGTSRQGSLSTSFTTRIARRNDSVVDTSACTYWLETIKHQGRAVFNGNAANYQVFRNVKDFGAKGDGVTDDTAAINAAISSGNRCAPGKCASSSTTPAVVYFPAGTYVVSTPIIDYYYTQIIGNPNCLPVVKASSKFNGRWVIDGDQYQSSGSLGYGSTDVFWRQVQNLVIDMTSIPASNLVAGIHWPTAQATSLQNIIFRMATGAGVQHEGLFIESGSGGFMEDLTFYGGFHGLTVGNQQFTMRNLTFYNAVTAISMLWDWGWTFQGIKINNCGTGLDMSALNKDGSQGVGSITFLDGEINNTPVGFLTARNATSTPPSGGSLILENVKLNNVATAVKGTSGPLLAGTSGKSTVKAWGQGHAYTPHGPKSFQGQFAAAVRPSSLLSGTSYYARSKPQYEKVPSCSIMSVKSAGAKGDGVTDDSAILNAILKSAAEQGKVVYFDAGTYLVKRTVFIPPGSRITGESYPVIMSAGSFFGSMSNPKPVIQVGNKGQQGSIEWSNMIVSTQGAQAGAILIEFNLAASKGLPSGIWDVHTRVGGFAGSNLQISQCPKTPTTTITAKNLKQQCIAAFMSMHVTSYASGVYMENVWLWVADHDVDDVDLSQITIYAGRGLLVDSKAGAVWLVGTAVEHHQFYEYQISQTRDIYAGQIQTETAYYQPNPGANIPFIANATYHDPVFTAQDSGWGLRILNSTDVSVYGAGLYSFFSNYNVHCSDQGNGEVCQKRIFSVDTESKVQVFNLNTVGTTKMITLGDEDVAAFEDNLNGFVDTIALFRTTYP